jgi:hypothetical protein
MGAAAIKGRNDMSKIAKSRFERGSGCYKCASCGRQTRSTGRGDNEGAGGCAECYDLGGIENLISDNGETPELLAEVAALQKLIVEKGGTIR